MVFEQMMMKLKTAFGSLIGVPVLAVLAACGTLPASGPSGRKVLALDQQQSNVRLPDVVVVDINDAVAQQLYTQKAQQSFAQWGEGAVSADAVGIGDVLEVTVWEAPPAVLFGGSLSAVGSGSAQAAVLPPQVVTPNGTVSVPFIGAVQAAGKTPLQIQEDIRQKLYRKANQPQVLVRLAQNNAANVSVIRPGNSVRLPLTAAGERVLDAVAAVGGSQANVQDTTVQLTRGQQVKSMALEELVANPRHNIRLRRNDVVTLITNPYSFTALGAVGRTQEVGFSVRGLSLAEAIGRMGGLQDRRADARGIFVFRYTPLFELDAAEQNKWRDKGYAYDEEIPVVYRLNLTDANALFWMQRIPVKDRDVVYVANAPLAEMQKFLQFIFSPVVSGAGSINSITR